MIAFGLPSRTVAIVAGTRTPWSKSGTALRDVPVADLAKCVLQETLYRSACPAEKINEVLLGNVVMPVDATNVARVAALWAGLPKQMPAMTIQRNCASGLEAVAEGALRIRAGQARVVLAGGAESMSRVPLLFPQETAEPMTRLAKARSWGQKATAVATLRPRHFKPQAALELGLTDPTCGLIMGRTAEILAQEFQIPRAAQDAYALRSHQRAAAAKAAGRLAEEIIPVYAGERCEPVTEDNGIREGQTREALAKLPPLFDRRDGSVTVGNSCQITDGAAALLLMDAELARAEGRTILGTLRGYACTGLDPARMGLGPVFAIHQLLEQTGVSMSDVGLWEINEAFAAQVLACLQAMESPGFAREHLGRDKPLGALDPDRLNVNGGSIALGHPVGATGTRLALTLLLEMQRRKVPLGVAALCVGGGQGAAMLLELGK